MPGVSCLYRRTSGIYAVRLAVPVRLRQSLDRGEIHVSTGLRDWNAAKLAALKIQFHWRERFMALDIEKLATASPLLHGDGLISIREAAKTIGLTEDSLLSELLNERAELYTQAQHWPGWSVADIDTIERDFDGTFILNDVEAQGVQLALSGAVRAFNPSATISALLSEGNAIESIFRLSDRKGFWPSSDVEVSLAAWMAQKSTVERVRVRLASHIPPAHSKPAAAPAIPAPAVLTIAESSTAKHGRKKFSELFELYGRHSNWGEDQRRRMTTETSLFIELMNDPTLASIELETIHTYAELLSRLPRDIYQSRRRFNIKSLLDLKKIAQQQSLPLKSKQTVKGHVGRVGEVLNFAVRKGMMPANPASGFQREWSIGKKARAQDERDEFTPEELTLIFSNATLKPGLRHWRPHYFWLPLLALVTGGRLNELSQLYLDDICQSKDDASVWYLDFNLNQPDKIDAADDETSDKSLKTVNSIRIVPLHESVIKAGLPEYVAALRMAGESRLFPELKRDRVKGYGKPAGSWFNGRFLGDRLGIERNNRKTFHSLRHNFATAVERLNLPERVMAQLLGHERGHTQGGTRYAKDRNAVELKPIIDRLVFPSLSSVSVFDVVAAKKALKVAKQFKASIVAAKAKA